MRAIGRQKLLALLSRYELCFRKRTTPRTVASAWRTRSWVRVRWTLSIFQAGFQTSKSFGKTQPTLASSSAWPHFRVLLSSTSRVQDSPTVSLKFPAWRFVWTMSELCWKRLARRAPRCWAHLKVGLWRRYLLPRILSESPRSSCTARMRGCFLLRNPPPTTDLTVFIGDAPAAARLVRRKPPSDGFRSPCGL